MTSSSSYCTSSEDDSSFSLSTNAVKRKYVDSDTKSPKKIKARKPLKLVDIDREVNNLDDLIELGKSVQDFDFGYNERYSFDVHKLKKLITPLKKLRDMIGMESIKKVIVEQIIYLLAGLSQDDDFKHTVIQGAPGCGKTTLALILSEIYYALGYVSKTDFHIVKRSDLIGQYLGHTAIKTQSVIDKAIGGVIFIDEAYSLGNKEGRDSFSKEAIDCLNQNLSERKGEFICIIAGYKEELDNCFFSFNPGLKRRFPFTYTIEKYTAEELSLIFVKKADDDGWSVEENTSIIVSMISKNINLFPYSGGDVETLLHMTKMAHSRRIFGKHCIQKKLLTTDDFKKGFELFRKINENKYQDEEPPIGMYN